VRSQKHALETYLKSSRVIERLVANILNQRVQITIAQKIRRCYNSHLNSMTGKFVTKEEAYGTHGGRAFQLGKI